MTAAFWLRDVVSHLVEEVRRDAVIPIKVPEPQDVWRAKLFCILSSQVTVAKASVAAARVFDAVGFFERSPAVREVADATCRTLMSSDVRYRFPQVKARQIAHSWFAFSQIESEYFDFLHSYPNEQSARVAVVQHFPGLGMKQASMLLRDIGFSQTLAVIDTHIHWYLSHVHGVREPVGTKKGYEAAERLMQLDADVYGIPLNKFDVVVFAAVKSVKAWRYHV